MLFDASTAPHLKPWLVRTLEPICDAEPGALADYILALLKHNVPESDMRKELTSQLDEFLEKECSNFIDTLFTAIRTKSYLPYDANASAPPKRPRAMEAHANAGIPIPLDGLIQANSSISPQRGLKRSMDYDERDGRPAKEQRLNLGQNGRGGGQWERGGGSGMEVGMSMGREMNENGRRLPQSYQPPDQKRGLCRDYHNSGYCARGALCKYSHGDEAVVPDQLFPMPGLGGHGPVGFTGIGGMPYGMAPGGAYDPNEAQLDMRPIPTGPARMGMNMGMGGGMGPSSGNGSINHQRPRGAPMISRGPSYHHRDGGQAHARNPPTLEASGELAVIQDLTPEMARGSPSQQPHYPPPLLPPPPQHGFSPYMNGGGQGYDLMQGSHIDDPRGPMHRQSGGGGFRGGQPRGGRGRGSAFDSNNHNNGAARPQKGGRTDKTLVVEKIPEDSISIPSLTNWFSRFGTVTNVAIDVRSAKALVTFGDHEEAHKAWKSEDAVFGNRFVKLFWHRPMEGHGVSGARALAASAPLVAKVAGNVPPPPATAVASTSTPTPKPLAAAPAAPATTTRKPSALAALTAKSQLLDQQIAEQKALMEKLGILTGTEKKEVMARLRKLNEEMTKPAASLASVTSSSPPALSRTGSSSVQVSDRERIEMERLDKELEGHSTNGIDMVVDESTEDLKAKLARLQAEAASLGLSEVESAPSYSNGAYRPFRGRGRATRGGYFRGAPMRGGAPRASMKLDNRPKKLLVKGASEDKLQSVKDWYETSGPLDSVETLDNGDILIAFKTRSAAEQGLAKGQNISQVGAVQVSWQSGPSVPALTAKTKAASPIAVASTEDKDMATTTNLMTVNTHERHDSPPLQEEELVASGWGGDGDEDGMGML